MSPEYHVWAANEIELLRSQLIAAKERHALDEFKLLERMHVAEIQIAAAKDEVFRLAELLNKAGPNWGRPMVLNVVL